MWFYWSRAWFCILELKVAARCGHPKLLADAMKSYPGLQDLNTRDCALEGFELFGSTKWKLDLLSSEDCDSHRLDKVNYSILRPNNTVRMSFICKGWDNSLTSFIRHPWYYDTFLRGQTFKFKTPSFTKLRRFNNVTSRIFVLSYYRGS